MNASWGIFGCIAVMALVVACSESPPDQKSEPEATQQIAETPTALPSPTATRVPSPAFRLTRISAMTSSPSQVQFVFSLRNREGHTIVLPVEEVKNAIRVYERASREGSWEEIDYSETGFFVHTAESFQMEVVVVLDFTNSMAQALLPDGKTGIEAMVDSFESAALALPDSHRIGVVEFHDRNVEPRVLSELTTDKHAVIAKVRQFESDVIDHGSSRAWDSLVAATDLFSDDRSVVRALIFLSDGRDTSSVHTRGQAVAHVADRNVQLYALGVGEVHQEGALRSVVAETGGVYFPVRDITGLENLLGTVVNNLRSLYKASYITLRRTGEYQAAVSVSLRGEESWFETRRFDVAEFFGPDNRGVVQFDPPSVGRFSGQANLFMRALHVPRGVDRILFRLDTNKPVSVEIVDKNDGGLLQGWVLSGPDPAGWYEASSEEPIDFGNFGPLFKLTIYYIDEPNLTIPVEFDNSIYADGKEFSGPARIRIGSTLRIAFASRRNGASKIHIMNDDGSGVIRLTDNAMEEYGPSWSPDGRRIAFHSDFDGGMSIHAMNADGSGVVRLTDSSEDDFYPDWSPDGTRIVFQSSRDGNSETYVISPDGAGLTRLTHNPAQDYAPGWSLDGRIAFHSLRDGNREIYVMNADGSGLTRLTHNPAQDYSPSWSPDGRIAFHSDRDGNSEIYVMNGDGSGPIRLTENPANDCCANWSSDGRIAFHSDRNGNSEIYVMNADGSGLARLTDHPADDYSANWATE